MSQMIPEELEEFVTITIPQEDGTDEAYIYRAKETETDVDVEPINDEEEYKKVIEAYEATFENN